MKISWIYLDKQAATIEALKDFNDMNNLLKNNNNILFKQNPNNDVPFNEYNMISDNTYEYLNNALEYVKWFLPAWKSLSEEEQYILQEFFINDNSKTIAVENIGEKLYLERAQVYRRKDKALNRLSLLLYGK